MKTKWISKIIILFLLNAAALGTLASSACALPEGGSVEAGSAQFDHPDAYTLNIHADDKTVINFNSFNIASNEVVNFIQPSSTATVLSRVTGSEASTIAGTLNANGVLFLVNQNGINFTPTANVNVNTLVCSTLSVSTNNFINGSYMLAREQGQPYAAILNEGRITANNLALIGSSVYNSGIISAQTGTIHLASGDKVTVSFDARNMIQVEVTEKTTGRVIYGSGETLEDAINNSGTIEAGRVYMTAKTANDIFEHAVNTTGKVKATRMIEENGIIKFVAEGGDMNIGGTVEALGKTSIYFDSNAKITFNGTISTENGGIYVGNEIAPREIASINGATLSANYIYAKANVINMTTNAPILDIYQNTQGMYISNVTAREEMITLEGTGVNLTYKNTTDLTLKTDGLINTAEGVVLTAQTLRLVGQGFGTNGTPVSINAQNIYINKSIGDINIAASTGLGTSILICGPPDDSFGAILYNNDANLTLNAQKVRPVGTDPIHFYGNITFNNFECTTAGKVMYFEAGKTYTFLGATKIVGGIGYAGFIKLFSSQESLPWYINMASFDYEISYVGIMDSHSIGAELIHAKPKSDFGGNTGWMHNDTVLTWAQLDAIRTNLSRTYILGDNLSASTEGYAAYGADWTPIGTEADPFTGTFDGNGYTISDLVINASANYVGLFGYTSDTSAISNLGLINVNVHGNGYNYVGALVGESNGTIDSCYSTGIVAGGVNVGGNYSWEVGGLVGSSGDYSGTYTNGNITNSYSTADVSGYGDVGGFIGLLYNYSEINNCYATGSVTGVDSVGGFVGFLNTTLNNCYSTGTVTGSISTGGFIGYQDGSANNCGWWTGSGPAYATGNGGSVTYEQADKSWFYSKTRAIYTTTPEWDFTTVPIWVELSSSYPLLDWEVNIWSAAGTGNWSTAGNWSKGVVPTAGTTVLFNGTSTYGSTIDASFAGSVAKLYIDTGYTGASATITQGKSLTILGDYLQAAGTLAQSTYAMTISGDFTITGGATFTKATGGGQALTFDGTGNITDSSTAGPQNLGAVTISNNSTRTQGSAIKMTSLTIASGSTYDLAGYAFSYSASGAVANSGTFRLQGIAAETTLTYVTNLGIAAGTVVYYGNNNSNTLTIKEFGATDYYNLTINDTNTTKAKFQLGANIAAAGGLNMTSGTLDVGAGRTITVTGTLAFGGGNITSTSQVIQITANTITYAPACGSSITANTAGIIYINSTGATVGAFSLPAITGSSTINIGTSKAPSSVTISGAINSGGGVTNINSNGGAVVSANMNGLWQIFTLDYDNNDTTTTFDASTATLTATGNWIQVIVGTGTSNSVLTVNGLTGSAGYAAAIGYTSGAPASITVAGNITVTGGLFFYSKGGMTQSANISTTAAQTRMYLDYDNNDTTTTFTRTTGTWNKSAYFELGSGAATSNTTFKMDFAGYAFSGTDTLCVGYYNRPGAVQITGAVTVGSSPVIHSRGGVTISANITNTTGNCYFYLDTDNDDTTTIFTQDAGTTVTGPSFQINFAANATTSATVSGINTGVGTVFYIGNYGAPGTLTISGGLTTLTTAYIYSRGDINISSSMSINSGSNNVFLYPNQASSSNTYRVYISGNSTITCATLTVNGGANSGLTINSGYTLTSAIIDISVTGTFDNQGTLQLKGTETLTGLPKDTNSGTVEYIGTNTTMNYGTSYYSVKFNNAATTWTLGSSPTINGTLTIAAGTLNTAGYALSPAVSLIMDGGLITAVANNVTITTPTITMNAGSITTTGASGNINLYSTSAHGTFTLNTVTAAGFFSIGSGSSNAPGILNINGDIISTGTGNRSYIYASGNMTVAANISISGTYLEFHPDCLNTNNDGNGVRFTQTAGALTGSILIYFPANSIANFEIAGLYANNGIQISNPASLSITDTLHIGSTASLTVKGNITVSADITGSSGYNVNIYPDSGNTNNGGLGVTFAQDEGTTVTGALRFMFPASSIADFTITGADVSNYITVGTSASDCPMTVNISGTLTSVSSISVRALRDINQGASLSAGNGSSIINLYPNQESASNTYRAYISGNSTITCSTYTVTGNGGANSGLTINSGFTLTSAASTIAVGTSNTFVNNGTLQLLGTETLTNLPKDIAHGTVEYIGTNTTMNYGTSYYSVKFNNAATTWTLGAPLAVNGTLIMTAGTLVLGANNVTTSGFTITGGSITRTSGTFNGGVLTANGTTFIVSGGAIFNGEVTVTYPSISLNGATFNSTTYITKTGVANDYSTGGNTFNGTTTLNNSTTSTNGAAGQLIMAQTNGDIFNGDLTVIGNGVAGNYTTLAYNNATSFNCNITFTINGGNSIAIGRTTVGTATLGAGKTFSVNGDGVRGYLTLNNFTQSDANTAQTINAAVKDLTLTNASFAGAVNFTVYKLTCTNSVFNGSSNAITPTYSLSGTSSISGSTFNNLTLNYTGIGISTSIFNGTTIITKTGTQNEDWTGGNTFNGTTTITNSTTDSGGAGGQLRMATVNGDTFNGDVNFVGSGAGNNVFAVAKAGTNVFAGNVTVSGTALSGFTFGANGGTMQFTKASDTQTLNTAGKTIPRLVHSGAGTLQLTGSNLTVNAVLTNSAGTLDLNGKNLIATSATFSNDNGTIQLKGNETITGLTMDTTHGTVKYIGTGSYSGDLNSGFGNTYNNLTIAGTNSADVWTRTANLTLNGVLSVTGGTLAISTFDLAVTGASNVTGGTVTLNTPTNPTGGWSTNGLTIDANGIVTCSNSARINDNGTWDSSEGTFNKGSSTVVLSGTGDLKTDGSYGAIFNNLQMAASLGDTKYTTTLQSTIYTNGMVWGGGNIDFNGKSLYFYLGNGVSFDGNGTTVSGSGTLNTRSYTSSLSNLNLGSVNLLLRGQSTDSNANITLSGTIRCGALTVSAGANPPSLISATLITAADLDLTATSIDFGSASYSEQGSFDGTNGGTLNINGNVLFSTRTYAVNLGASTWNVTGNWTCYYSGGTAGTSTVNFTGTATGKTITSGGSPFYNLAINGVGGAWAIQDTNLTVSNNIVVAAGTLTSCLGTLSVGGNWLQTGGTFTHNGGTVDFTGSGTQDLSLGTSPFNNLTHSGSGTLYVWSYRKGITIDYTKVTGDQILFPVLVYINGDTDLYAHAQSLGQDLVFIDSNGNRLAHEIEYYSRGASSDSAYIWVKLLTLSSTVDTTFYMNYGNSSCTSQANAAGVWTNGYAGVWHLPDGAILTANDSTSYGNAGTIIGATAVSGTIDGGGNFDGYDDYIYRADTPSMDIGTSDTTLSGWFKFSGTQIETYAALVGKGFLANLKGQGLFTDVSTNLIKYQIRNVGTVVQANSNTALNDGAWHYVVGVADRDSVTGVRLYIDGVQQTQVGDATIVNVNLDNSSAFAIGTRDSGGIYGFDYKGASDEIRLSVGIARSAGWIATEYANQSDQTVGSGHFIKSIGSQTTNNLSVAGNLSNTGGTTSLGTGTVAVTGNVSNSADKTLIATSGNFSVGGSWANSGTFTRNSGTVTFNGTAQMISGATTFYHLVIGTTSPQTTPTVDIDSVTVAAYDVVINSGSTLRVDTGDILTTTTTVTNNGAINISAGSITATTELYNYGTVTQTGGTVATNAAANYLGIINFTGGTYDISAGTIHTANSFVNKGGRFNVSGTAQLNLGVALYNYGSYPTSVINITGGTVTLSSVYIYAGTISHSDGTISASWNFWVRYSGVYQGSGSALLKFGNSIWLNVAGSYFSHVEITGNNVSIDANTNQTFVINGNFIIDSGKAFNANGKAMSVAGNWVNNGGTFTANGGTVTFNGSGVQTLESNGGESTNHFYDLIFSGAGTLQPKTSDLYVDGALTFNAGAGHFDADTYDKNIYVTGNVTMSNSTGTVSLGGGTWTLSGSMTYSGAGTWNYNTSTVIFDGTGSITPKDAAKFYNLTIASGANITYNSSNRLYHANQLNVNGLFTVGGSGLLYTQGAAAATVSSTGHLTVDGAYYFYAASAGGGLVAFDYAGGGRIDGSGNIYVRASAATGRYVPGTFDCAVNLMNSTNDGGGANYIVLDAGGAYVFNKGLTFSVYSSGTVYLNNNVNGPASITVNGDLIFNYVAGSTGNFVVNDTGKSVNWTIKGNVTKTGVGTGALTWTAGSGTITFSGAGTGTQTINFPNTGGATPGPQTLEGFVINDSGAIKQLTNSVTIASLSVSAGTIDINTLDLTVSGASNVTGGTVTIGATTNPTGGWTTASLTLGNASSGGTITCAGASLINVSGDVTLGYSGQTTTVSMGDGTWTVGGSFNNQNVTTFTMNTYTLKMTGTGNILSNGPSRQIYRLWVFSGAHTTISALSTGNVYINNQVELDGELIINYNTYTPGALIINSTGTLNINTSDFYLYNISGSLSGLKTFDYDGGARITSSSSNALYLQNWSSSGTFVTGTFDCNVVIQQASSNAKSIALQSGEYIFNKNLTFLKQGSYTGDLTILNSTNGPSITVKGDLIFNMGVNATGVIYVDDSGKAVNWVIYGNVLKTGTGPGTLSWTAGTGTITFQGAGTGTQTIYFPNTGGETPGPQSLEGFVINDSGAIKQLSNSVAIASLSVTAGTLAIGAYDFTVSGASNVTGGTVTITTPTNPTGGWTTTGGLTLGTNGAITCSGVSRITVGSYNQTAGAFTADAASIKTNGNWTKSGGTFATGTSTLTFLSSGNLNVNSSLRNLTINSGVIVANTYGPTTISAVLMVNGTFSTASQVTTWQLAVGSAGLVTGTGSIYMNASSITLTAGGHINVATLYVTNAATLSSGTYESATVIFYGASTSTKTLASGTYIFTGNLSVIAESGAAYTISNTNNPSFEVRGDITFVTNGTGTITWTPGTTGTILLSGGDANIDFGGRSVEGITVSADSGKVKTFTGNVTVNGILTVNSTVSIAANKQLGNYQQNIIIGPGGVITGAGTLFVSGNSSGITQQSGTISVAYMNVQCQGTAASSLVPGTYDAGLATFYTINPNARTYKFAAGSYIFTGNVIFDRQEGNPDSLFTIDTTNNPSLEFRGNVTLQQTAGIITWNKGTTGTILLSGGDANINFLGQGVDAITVNATGIKTLTGNVTTAGLTLTAGTLATSSGCTNVGIGAGGLAVANDAVLDFYTAGNPDLDIIGSVTLNNGVVKMGNGTWTVGGDFIYENISNANLMANGSTVKMTGNGAKLRCRYDYPWAALNNVTIDTGAYIIIDTGTKASMFGTLKVYGILEIETSAIMQNGGFVVAHIYPTGRLTGSGTYEIDDVYISPSFIMDAGGVFDVATLALYMYPLGTTVSFGSGTYGSDTIRTTVIIQNYYPDQITYSLRFAAGATPTVFKGELRIINPIAGSAINIDNNVNSPSFEFQGNVTLTESGGAINWNKGSGSISLTGGNAQDINFAGKSIEALTVNKTSGTTATLISALNPDALTLTSGTLDANDKAITVAGTLQMDGGAITAASKAINVIANNIVMNAGSIYTTTLGNISLKANVDFVMSGTITSAGELILYADYLMLNTGTLTISGDLTAASTIDMYGNAVTHTSGLIHSTSGNIYINAEGTSPGTFSVKDITADNGYISIGSDIEPGNLQINGTITNSGAGKTITLRAWNSMTINGTVVSNNGSVTIVLTRNTGSLTLSADQAFANGSYILVPGTFTIGTGRTLELSGANSAVINTGGSFVNYGTLKLQGDEAMTGFANDPYHGGTVTYIGSGAYNSGLIAGSNYYNLKFASAAAGSWKLASDLTVLGNIEIAAGTLNANTKKITVSGNWTNHGTFNHGNGEVVFTPTTTSIISGSNTFFDLECESAGKTLTFEAGTLQSIEGYLNLKGAAGNRLTFNSTIPGTQWEIDPKGTVYVGYLNGFDSKNIGTAIYDPNSTFVNSPGWFGTARPVPPTPNSNPNSPQINDALFFPNFQSSTMLMSITLSETVVEIGPGVVVATSAITPAGAVVPAPAPSSIGPGPVNPPVAPIEKKLFEGTVGNTSMPAVVSPSAFAGIKASEALPVSTGFSGAAPSVAMPSIVSPSVFAGATTHAALPKPPVMALASGVAVMPAVVSPAAFSGITVAFEVPMSTRFDGASGMIVNQNFMVSPVLSAAKGSGRSGSGTSPAQFIGTSASGLTHDTIYGHAFINNIRSQDPIRPMPSQGSIAPPTYAVGVPAGAEGPLSETIVRKKDE